MLNLIGNYGAEVSFIIRLLATIILLWQIIPLQVKESQVRNGLRKFRVQLLIVDFTLLLTNLFAMVLIAMTKGQVEFLPVCIQIVNAISILILVIVLYYMYHDQYTPESKEIHRRVDRLKEKNIIS